MEEQAIFQQNESSFLDDLLNFIEEEEVEELSIEEEASAPFSIQSNEQADYFIRRLKEVQNEISEAEATAKRQLEKYEERVDRWLQSTVKPLENQKRRLSDLLQVYAADRLDGSKKKSLKLIEGTLQFRKLQPKYDYDDEIFVPYIKQNYPTFTKTKVTIDKAAFKKEATLSGVRLNIEGKTVPGVTVIEQDDAFSVKF